jgi:hypothetical protein
LFSSLYRLEASNQALPSYGSTANSTCVQLPHLEAKPQHGERLHVAKLGIDKIRQHPAVAAQYVEFEKANFETSFHFIGARVESPNRKG